MHSFHYFKYFFIYFQIWFKVFKKSCYKNVVLVSKINISYDCSWMKCLNTFINNMLKILVLLIYYVSNIFDAEIVSF